MLRSIAVAALICVVPGIARGEECKHTSVMHAGAQAACSGLLVPGPRIAVMLAAEERAKACAVRLAGAVEEVEACQDAAAERADVMREALRACHDRPAPAAPVWSWASFAIGAAVAGLVVVGIAAAVR